MEKFKHFEYFVQKTMPLVFDNTLSLYEVVSKLIDYINKLIDGTNELIDDVSNLKTLVNELTELVEKYHNDLTEEVIAEVEKQLSDMIENGKFDDLISKYANDYIDSIVESKLFVYEEFTENILNGSVKDVSVGNLFRTQHYNSTADNAGSFFIVVSGKTSEIDRNIENTKYYLHPIITNNILSPDILGAGSDSDYDSTQDIQDCIDYCIANNTDFKMSPRIYYISSPINILMFDNASASTPVYYINGHMFDFNNAILTPLNDMVLPCAIRTNIYTDSANRHLNVLKNIRIDGVNEQIHTGLFFEHLSTTVIENITIQNTRRGILYVAGNESPIKNAQITRDSTIDILSSSYVDNLENVFENYANSIGYSSYPSHDLTDNLKTDCNGIESYISDGYFEDLIIVNYFTSFNNWLGGNNQIVKFHGWNSGQTEQLKESAIIVNAGQNFYTNCTLDRFGKAVYLKYNVPIYLSQCTIINSKQKNDTSDRTAYVFYFGTYSENGGGSNIKISNSRIASDYSAGYYDGVPNTYLTNIDDLGCKAFIKTNNVSFYNILNNFSEENIDKTLNTTTTEYPYSGTSVAIGGVSSVAGTLELSEASDDFSGILGDSYSASTQIGTSILRTSASAITNAVYNDSSIGFNVVPFVPKTENTTGSVQFTLSLKPSIFEINDIIAISFKYKTSGSGGKLYFSNFSPYTESATSLNLVSNNWTDLKMFGAIKSTSAMLFSVTVQANSEFDVANFRIYKVPNNCIKYFMESNQQYGKRILNLIGDEYSNVEIPINEDVKYLSSTISYDIIDYDSSFSNYNSDTDYKIRYDAAGHPIVFNSQTIYRQFIFSKPLLPEFMPISIQSLSTYLPYNNKSVSPYFEIYDDSETTKTINNNTYNYIFNVQNDESAQVHELRQYFPENSNSDTSKGFKYKICQISTNPLKTDCVSKNLPQKWTLYDADYKTLLYPNGEIFAIKEDSENDSEFPTVCVEIFAPTRN